MPSSLSGAQPAIDAASVPRWTKSEMIDNPSEYSRSVTWPAPVPLHAAAYRGRPASRVPGNRTPRLLGGAPPERGAPAPTQAVADDDAGAGAAAIAAVGRSVSGPNRTWVNSSSLTSLSAG